MALAFAVAALVMFVTWNLLPFRSFRDDAAASIAAMVIWPETVRLEHYVNALKSRHQVDSMIAIIALSLLQSGMIVLTIIPFWKVIHASNYFRITLAIMNLFGGGVILWFTKVLVKMSYPEGVVVVLMAFSMLASSAALFIFKNELELRHDLEMKKTMGG